MFTMMRVDDDAEIVINNLIICSDFDLYTVSTYYQIMAFLVSGCMLMMYHIHTSLLLEFYSYTISLVHMRNTWLSSLINQLINMITGSACLWGFIYE